VEDQKDFPKPFTLKNEGQADLPLPEKEIPAHGTSASQGDPLRSYGRFFRNKLFLIFVILSFIIAFLIGGFALGASSY